MRHSPFFMILGVVALIGCHSKPPVDSKADSAAAASKSGLKPMTTFVPEQTARVSGDDVPLLEQINRENNKVTSAALPSIVRVSSSLPAEGPSDFMGKQLPFNLPVPSHRSLEDQSMAFGSGIIISADGYIVTNRHVVEDAENIKVELYDKRVLTATLIASDKVIDVAILKVDAKELTPLPWADSDKVEVGDQVYAIGNPFNLGDSVSKGIVSASARTLPGSSNYADYIQTDAAINPGNSGGALVDIHGQLVGINIVIASTSRANQGVGFAIPSNLLRYAVQGLLKEGHLARSYLGVRLPAMVDDGVMNQLGLNNAAGALVSGVSPGSPADAAKLQPADFITAIDGHKVGSVDELRLVVAQIPVGTNATIDFIRGTSTRKTKVKLSAFPEEAVPATDSAPAEPDSTLTFSEKESPVGSAILGGLQVVDLNDETRLRFKIKPWVRQGAVISSVQAGSAGEARGFEPGNVIELVCARKGNLQKIANAKDMAEFSKGLKNDQAVVLLVDHDFSSSFIYLSPGK